MDMTKSKILLVDDEPELLLLVRSLLKKEGFEHVYTAADCRTAVEQIRERQIHLMLLDVMLPDGNGFDLYESLKSDKLLENVPVIFLSARDEDAARLKGLGLGADDYITKPFLPEELLLRIKAVLRRTYSFHDSDIGLILGDASVSLEAGTIEKNGETLSITAKEYAILKKLAENRGRIVTIDSLCDSLWPDGSYGLKSSLIVHIRHLREKIEADPSKPKYLVTVRGLGYKLCR